MIGDRIGKIFDTICTQLSEMADEIDSNINELKSRNENKETNDSYVSKLLKERDDIKAYYTYELKQFDRSKNTEEECLDKLEQLNIMRAYISVLNRRIKRVENASASK